MTSPPPHLLAAVALATRQYPNALGFKTGGLCEAGQDQIDWYFLTVVSDVIIDYECPSALSQQSSYLENHISHFQKIILYEHRYVLVTQLSTIARIVENVERFVKSRLTIIGSFDFYRSRGGT
jgi:hypothetical protein